MVEDLDREGSAPGTGNLRGVLREELNKFHMVFKAGLAGSLSEIVTQFFCQPLLLAAHDAPMTPVVYTKPAIHGRFITSAAPKASRRDLPKFERTGYTYV